MKIVLLLAAIASAVGLQTSLVVPLSLPSQDSSAVAFAALPGDAEFLAVVQELGGSVPRGAAEATGLGTASDCCCGLVVLFCTYCCQEFWGEFCIVCPPGFYEKLHCTYCGTCQCETGEEVEAETQHSALPQESLP